MSNLEWDLSHAGRFPYVEEKLGFGGARPSLQQRLRRALLFAFLSWAVPFALSFVDARTHLVLPFALDIEAYVRGLVATPLLALAEWPVEYRLRGLMERLSAPPFMRPRARAEASDLVRAARRLAGHPVAEGALVVLAFAVGYEWLVRHQIGLPTWISSPSAAGEGVTAAGAWAAAVTVPLNAFLLLRWVWRWAVLGLLLWRVSRTPLRLVPNHRDRAAGVGFLSEVGLLFAWTLMAASSMISAKWMDAILYTNVPPRAFLYSIYAAGVLGVVGAFLPLVAFTPLLLRTSRLARRRYGLIVARHGLHVEAHWRAGHEVTAEDASSMCDLNSIYETVAAIRFIPIRPRHVLAVAAATIVPMTPVILEIVPLHDIAQRLLAALV